MPIFRIPRQHIFPDPAMADPNGLLGVGGDLDAHRLVYAYRMGIFPWYSDGQPVLWWSPDPRLVVFPDELHVPRSLGKRIRRGDFTITLDTAFRRVIDACAQKSRPDQPGTWITMEMRDAYVRLHEMGIAHSCEAWDGDVLVGGLYGVAIGRMYCGESMFTDRSDASKIAFVHLTRQLQRWGYPIVDCQVHTEHLARFGAREISRGEYLNQIGDLVDEEASSPLGTWHFDEDFICDGR
jgi:leucyl/phenylalanyl-tRNA--protein transferase